MASSRRNHNPTCVLTILARKSALIKPLVKQNPPRVINHSGFCRFFLRLRGGRYASCRTSIISGNDLRVFLRRRRRKLARKLFQRPVTGPLHGAITLDTLSYLASPSACSVGLSPVSSQACRTAVFWVAQPWLKPICGWFSPATAIRTARIYNRRIWQSRLWKCAYTPASRQFKAQRSPAKISGLS